MKKKPEYIEGNEAAERFESALGRILRVPKAELDRKLAEEKSANAGKQKRGPKPKNKA